MTSSAARHRYVADVLYRAFDVAGIVSEAKRPAPEGKRPLFTIDGGDIRIIDDRLAPHRAIEKQIITTL